MAAAVARGERAPLQEESHALVIRIRWEEVPVRRAGRVVGARREPVLAVARANGHVEQGAVRIRRRGVKELKGERVAVVKGFLGVEEGGAAAGHFAAVVI